jgi:hypothetical protein
MASRGQILPAASLTLTVPRVPPFLSMTSNRVFEGNLKNREEYHESTYRTCCHGVSAPAAMAQQRSLKDQLVGTWMLVSDEFTPLNGTKRQIVNPKGILMFDAGGRYTTVLMRGDRPKYRSPGAPTTEEIAATVRDYFAGNFGTWSVPRSAGGEGSDHECSETSKTI